VYRNATYTDPITHETSPDMQSVLANIPNDDYNLAGCRQTEYLDVNQTCRACNLSLTCPPGQMPICGYRFNECRGGEGVKLIGRDGEAKQCYDQNAWPWQSSYTADRDKKFTDEFGPGWRDYERNHPKSKYSYGKGTDFEGWCDEDGNFVGTPGTKSTAKTGGRRDSEDELVAKYGEHGHCDDCFPCYPQIEPETPHCVCNWGFRDVDASTDAGDTVHCVAGTTDQYIPYTKIFQNGQRASYTIQPCEGSACNAAGIKITLVALRELRADGSVIFDAQYPNMNDQLERHDEDGSMYIEQPTSKKYRGKSSAVPHRFGTKGASGATGTGPSDGRPKNYCQCRHTMEYDELDDIDFRVNDVTYDSLEFPGGQGRIKYIDWQVSPNGYRGFDARIASLIIDQDELDYSFGFVGEAPGTVNFFSPATSFAFSTVVFDEEAAFCLDPNEILGCNDYITATPTAVQGCQHGSLGQECGGSYAWYIDFNFSSIIAGGEEYNGTEKVLTNSPSLVFWGQPGNFQPDEKGGASGEVCDHRRDQRNPDNWAEPERGLVQYDTSCWHFGTTNNVTLNVQSRCTSNDGDRQVAAICLFVQGSSGWCGCVRETHVMKRGSFKFAIEAHNYTYSVNGDSFEVEFTIEQVTALPKGVFYPGYTLPAWGGLVDGVQGEQSFLVPSDDGYGDSLLNFANLSNIYSDLNTLNPALTARYNSWNPDNSTSLDGAPTYNYTDYPDGDFRLGASGTLRLSRFYSDDNTLHWHTFPPGYTFAGYADPNCSGNVALTVRIRFPRPPLNNNTDPNLPIDYIWDPVMHFGSDASIPTSRPVYDPKAPVYQGRAYLGNKYATDRSVISAQSVALSAGAIVGIVVAGAVVVLLVVIGVVMRLRSTAKETTLRQQPAISSPTNTHDLIHI